MREYSLKKLQEQPNKIYPQKLESIFSLPVEDLLFEVRIRRREGDEK